MDLYAQLSEPPGPAPKTFPAHYASIVADGHVWLPGVATTQRRCYLGGARAVRFSTLTAICEALDCVGEVLHLSPATR